MAFSHGCEKSQRWSKYLAWNWLSWLSWLSWMLNLLLASIWNDLKWSASIFWLKWSEMQIFQRLKYWKFLDEASRDFGCKCVNHWLLCIWVLVHFFRCRSFWVRPPNSSNFLSFGFFSLCMTDLLLKSTWVPKRQWNWAVNRDSKVDPCYSTTQIQDFFRGGHWSAWGSSWLWRTCHSRRFWGLPW